MHLDPHALLDLARTTQASLSAVRREARKEAKEEHERRLAAYHAELEAWKAKTIAHRPPKPHKEVVPNEPALLAYSGDPLYYNACDASLVEHALSEVLGLRSQRIPSYARGKRGGKREGVEVAVSAQWLVITWATGCRRIPMIPCDMADADLSDAALASRRVAA